MKMISMFVPALVVAMAVVGCSNAPRREAGAGEAVALPSRRPLKVFILVGQSNMQGHAQVRTLDHLAMDPETAPMLEDLRDEEGKPVVVDDVWISELGSGPKPDEARGGKLTAGFGAARGGPKFGPEFAFGVYMRKALGEPFLIIKTAWGGKSLNTDFRPPSAGPYEWSEAAAKKLDQKKRDEKAEATGKYYRLMLAHVKKVLGDIGRVYPDYDPEQGHEIAGLVWFQGWNDMVDRGTYPRRNHPGGYDKYTEVLCHFIRDVRKDLGAPGMPFVIGVIGVGGVSTAETEAARPPRYRGIVPGIRHAMAAPAEYPEFKGNVAAVMTARYWDDKLEELDARMGREVKAKVKAAEKERKLSREERDSLYAKLKSAAFTPEELKYLETGKSNFGFHYMGSVKIMARIGRGFAGAMLELMEKRGGR